jgi:hypothetical protein
MGLVLSIVWIVIALIVSATSSMVWVALMLPNRVEQARERIEKKPLVSLFVGLGVGLLTIVVTGAMVQNGRPAPVQLAGWILAGPTLAGWVIGGAGFARIISGRLSAQLRGGSPFLALVGGALCTSLSGLLPIIGWFVFLPLVGFISIGAGVPAIFARRRPARLAEPGDTPPSDDRPGGMAVSTA